MKRKAWQQEPSLGQKLKNILCHHDWHFILCFLILVFIFIISILIYSECDMRENISQKDKLSENQVGILPKDVIENEINGEAGRKEKKTTIGSSSSTTVPTTITLRLSSLQPTTPFKTAFTNHQHSKTNIVKTRPTKQHTSTNAAIKNTSPITTLPPEIFTTTRGWVFPKQLHEEAKQRRLKLINMEEEGMKCSFILIFIVLSAVGLLLLLLLWCLVILHC